MHYAFRLLILSLLILTGFAGSLARAVEPAPVVIKLSFKPDLQNGKRIYETCATCHLPEGWGNEDGAYPQIAGQHQNVLIQQLLEIRSGRRENPTMYPFVQERTIGGYQSLADVVAYISTLPMHPRHRTGPWSKHTTEFKKGEQLYNSHCANCHGYAGEGDNELLTPSLQGQHYPYVMRQINQFVHQQRETAIAMKVAIDLLDNEQLRLVVNYVSQLPVPEDKVAPSVNWRNKDFY